MDAYRDSLATLRGQIEHERATIRELARQLEPLRRCAVVERSLLEVAYSRTWQGPNTESYLPIAVDIARTIQRVVREA